MSWECLCQKRIGRPSTVHSGQRAHLCIPVPQCSSFGEIRYLSAAFWSQSLIDRNVTAPGAYALQPPSFRPGQLSAPHPTTLGKSDIELPSHPIQGQKQVEIHRKVMLQIPKDQNKEKKGVASEDRR